MHSFVIAAPNWKKRKKWVTRSQFFHHHKIILPCGRLQHQSSSDFRTGRVGRGGALIKQSFKYPASCTIRVKRLPLKTRGKLSTADTILVGPKKFLNYSSYSALFPTGEKTMRTQHIAISSYERLPNIDITD